MNFTGYPAGVPDKFSPSGQVQYFPGNTIISHIPHVSPLLQTLCFIYALLSIHPLASKFVLNPPSSWHMTILEGVTDKYRQPELWPAGKNNLTIEEYTDLITPKLKDIGRKLESEGLAPPYQMKAVGFKKPVNNIGIRLEAATPAEEKRMRRLRDRLSEAMGFRFPTHDTYVFHVTLGYTLRFLTEEEQKQLQAELEDQLKRWPTLFELNSPEFCLFDDMFAFDTQFLIEKEGGSC